MRDFSSFERFKKSQNRNDTEEYSIAIVLKGTVQTTLILLTGSVHTSTVFLNVSHPYVRYGEIVRDAEKLRSSTQQVWPVGNEQKTHSAFNISQPQLVPFTFMGLASYVPRATLC